MWYIDVYNTVYLLVYVMFGLVVFPVVIFSFSYSASMYAGKHVYIMSVYILYSVYTHRNKFDCMYVLTYVHYPGWCCIIRFIVLVCCI